MKAKEIQELIDFIAKSGLEEVNVETDSFKISVKRSNFAANPETKMVSTPLVSQPSQNQVLPTSPEVSTANHKENATTQEASTSQSEANYVEIKSPMIGTFYRSPNPDSPSFVNIGDSVKEGDVVCIIEAMKLFNEIESEVSGKIVKVLVDNASPIEYDQPLFLVDPS